MIKKLLLTMAIGSLGTNAFGGCGDGDISFKNGVYRCTEEISIGDLDGDTLGIVKRIDFTVIAELDTGKIPDYLREDRIIVPTQYVRADVVTNGTPIVLNIKVDLTIGLTPDARCKVSSSNMSLDIYGGNLPTWILKAIEKRANKEVNRTSKKELLCGRVQPLLDNL